MGERVGLVWVTHYTLVSTFDRATAEKHDAFFETSYDSTDPVEKFGGHN
jgi:glutamine synthetase